MILSRILEYVFPSRCLGCGALTGPGHAACERCLTGIPLHGTFFCGECKSRLPTGTRICHHAFPYLLGAATDYEIPIVRALIYGLKFEQVTDAAAPLGALIVRYLAPLPPFAQRTRSTTAAANTFIVVPMPLGARRRRERGFNQAERIATVVAEHFGLPLVAHTLIRTKNTPPQSAEKNLERRRTNVHGCFALTDPASLRNKRVLLIDDVTTSGATFFEAAMVLRSAHVRTVIACAVARAGA